MGWIDELLQAPILKGAARGATNWVDLQWSLLIAQLREVAPLAHGTLLDVGCGEKPYEDFFTPYVTSYLGVEHEASFSHTTAATRGKKPDVLYNGECLPFADESFDTVLSVQVLEHTERPQELFAEMARVLRPGGTLLLSAPFSFRLHEEPFDFYRFTPHGLREMAKRNRLDVERTMPAGSLWSVLGHKLNSYLAFQVADLGAVTQRLGKGGHESVATNKPRVWSLPFVLPTMVLVSAAARVLDRVLRDDTEALSFMIVATKRVV